MFMLFSSFSLLGLFDRMHSLLSLLLFFGNETSENATGVFALLVAGAAVFVIIFSILYRPSKEGNEMDADVLYRLSTNLDKHDASHGVSDFLQSFDIDLFQETGARLIRPIASEGDHIFGELGVDPSKLRGTIQVKNSRLAACYASVRDFVVVPLPIMNEGSAGFAVLGASRRQSKRWRQSLTAMLLAILAFYKAEKDANDRQQMVISVMDTVISAIDAKDAVTSGHSRRVADMSKSIALWLGFDEKRAEEVEFCALLHDIGKIGIDDSVLNKPGALTDDDYAQMKLHPSKGAEILGHLGLSDEVMDGILHHHERVDGRGYPDGVTGSEMTAFSRILKVADVYDALTNSRQYKKAWSTSRALDLIYSGLGTEFDREIGQVFIDHMKPPGWRYSGKEGVSSISAETTEKAGALGRDLWRRFAPSLNGESIRTMHGDVAESSASSFIGVEWGEWYYSPSVLALRPTLIEFDGDTESDFCALRLADSPLYELACAYFGRHCLCAGFLLIRAQKEAEVRKLLTSTYGNPIDYGDILAFTSQSHVVTITRFSGRSVVCHISGYLCSEI